MGVKVFVIVKFGYNEGVRVFIKGLYIFWLIYLYVNLYFLCYFVIFIEFFILGENKYFCFEGDVGRNEVRLLRLY